MLWRRIIPGFALVFFVGIGLLSGNGQAQAAPSAQAAPLATPHLLSKQILAETSIDGPGLTKNDVGHEGDRTVVMAWTGTDSLHRLNLLTSNNGTNWINKRTLGETSFVRPAVERATYMEGGEVVLAWTGTDARHTLNVIWNAYNNGNSAMKKVTFWGETSFTAPAIAMSGGFITLVWAGTDANHSLNIMGLSGPTLKVVTPKRILPFSSSARPSISRGPTGPLGSSGMLVAWTNASGHLSFASATSGFNFGAAKVSTDASFAGPDFFSPGSIYIPDTTTPKYWWAWTGADPHRSINVEFNSSATWPPASNKSTLGEWALGGPVMAWRGETNRVVLAWTGTDPHHHLNVGVVSAA